MPTYEYRDVDWSNNYRAIGEFIVEFEKIVTKIKFEYNCLAQWEGLKIWALSANLLNIPTIGPEALAVAYCAAISVVSSDKTLHSRAAKLFPRIKRLVEVRNEIVHGEWRMGPEYVIISDKPTLPVRQGIKRKTGKRGEQIKDQPTVAEFEALIAECRAITKEVQDIFGEVITETHEAKYPSKPNAAPDPTSDA